MEEAPLRIRQHTVRQAGDRIEQRASRRHALLIGINKYAKLNVCDLKGCVNDVQSMAELLCSRFGFTEADITKLIDEQASRDAILSSMDALVERTGEDDVVVLHYSGHGSQMTDREGDEPDGMDETIVPHDSGRGEDPNRDITDDEVYVRLLGLTQKTRNATIIFDCCHSGTGCRDAFGDKIRRVPNDSRSAADLPPSTLPLKFADQAETKERLCGGLLPVRGRYAFIAGCTDDECAYEHRERSGNEVVHHGALTFFLLKELAQAGPESTLRDVFEQARDKVSLSHPHQHPCAEGALEREVFGTKDFQTQSFLQVTERSESVVMLSGGLIHGLTRGSHWAVHQRGVRALTQESPVLGIVEITTLSSVTAEAKILSEHAPGAILKGSSAFEAMHSFGNGCLAITIRTPELIADDGGLKVLIEKSPFLSLSEEGDMQVYALSPRAVATDGDPVPQLGSIAKAVWAVVDREGVLRLPPIAMSQPGATGRLVSNLEKLARQQRVRDIRNPDWGSSLRDKIGFELLRNDPTYGWAAAQCDINSPVTFKEGDLIAFEVCNRYRAPIYISILDLGLTGGVSLLYPPEGSSERLFPGIKLRVGVRPGEQMRLVFPEGLMSRVNAHAQPSSGQEVFKLFASERPADFRPLLQGAAAPRGSSRSVIRGLSLMERVIDLAFAGARSLLGKQSREDWTTVERPFLLSPR